METGKYRGLEYEYEPKTNTLKFISGKIIWNRGSSNAPFLRRNDNIEHIKFDDEVKTDHIKDMSYMFANCRAKSLDISNFDTRNVRNMSGMFFHCQIGSLNLSNFDTRNVRNMSNMFEGCNIQSFLDISSFNTRKVKDMNSMFKNFRTYLPSSVTCTHYSYPSSSVFMGSIKAESIHIHLSVGLFSNGGSYWRTILSLDLSNFNTHNVTNMSNMFNGCQVNLLDLSNFDTYNATNMGNMFKDCVFLRKVKTRNNRIKYYFLNRNIMTFTKVKKELKKVPQVDHIEKIDNGNGTCEWHVNFFAKEYGDVYISINSDRTYYCGFLGSIHNTAIPIKIRKIVEKYIKTEDQHEYN